jgi:hypothetical protein
VEESINFVASNAEANAWDRAACAALIVDLQALRKPIVAAEARLVAAGPPPTASARNLAHYLALRRHDLRALQERLAAVRPRLVTAVDRRTCRLPQWTGVAAAAHRNAVRASAGAAQGPHHGHAAQ